MNTDAYKPLIHRTTVDYIPVVWSEPVNSLARRDLVIWLPGLGGSKEGLAQYMEDLVHAGFVALSFDPYDHGERMKGSREEFEARLNLNKRKYFWPMMTLTAEEFPRIIDWAIKELHITGKIMAGGISMGGDISVAATGLDHRIAAVAAGVSTPDWLRPGTNEGVSHPDAYAVHCYNRCNPITNLDKYEHCPAISFHNGADDNHVPPDGARRFVAALKERYRNHPDRLNITEYPVEHSYPAEMWHDSMEWFAKMRDRD